MSNKKNTAKANFEKTPYSEAIITGNAFMKALEPLCEVVTLAGSIRQQKEMIGDIDVVVIPKDDPSVFLEEVKNVIEYEYGATKKIFGMFQGRPINIFVTSKKSYGASLYQCTGPMRYNLRMRVLAKSRGFKLNEYGLFHRETGEYRAGETEQDIFDALNLTYKSPEERKGKAA
ncbi:MAG: hypothetical protein CBC29_06235 [Methylococcaceae bacterium TMED69]|nr:MAG: hypothetical protein CBC29_06235 [Methylococcaceae bacterium TMED69]|tara:strand:- start:93 stop:614 length:522 start_codon:yes stop_codon:yes gene_type:complete